ncbi:MAG TPA: ABC transporter ATP-binding protein [Pyrinomonadaceae bacterium]
MRCPVCTSEIVEGEHCCAPRDTDSTGVPPTAISVKRLSKAFGGQRVLSEVSLDIAGEEMLVVLGPSGSGKTTLLRIIAGLEQPDAGDIYLRGRRANHLPPQARGLGVVFQEQALFQRMTVEQNIAFGLRLRRAAGERVRATVDEMIELTRLREHRRKTPAQLSGGQRQRVAVARALAYRPDALLFDEPFSALDAVTRTRLRREVRVLLQTLSTPALFITHDQEEALELGDRIAVINHGRVEQTDTPFEIYNHPRNEFVATFLGAANVLLGRWREGRVRVGALDLKPPRSATPFAERQALKVVFRPEDVVLNFQPQLLGTPFYLGGGVVEEVSYTGPVERLVVRLHFRPHRAEMPGGPARRPHLSPAEEAYTEGFPVTVMRTKWEAADMELSAGDPVAVGLKDYRLLAHYPLDGETGAKALRR